MIEYVGTGVAMGNANKALKDQADFITDKVSEDGIYKGFKKLGLI
jgi:hydroxymethylpyrimidine pyrophosphatase-like HAD family hydrolase